MSKRKDNKNVAHTKRMKTSTTDTTRPSSSVGTDSMDIPDTLTLAKLDRENQGSWEAEYSYGGESDLSKHSESCVKNPGHKKFIPVDKFSIQDLPEGYRDTDIVDFIRTMSDLTVRVAVAYVSNKRPRRAPGSDKPYPGYSVRGQRKMTLGTGWITCVQAFNNSEGFICQCKHCRSSSTPETNFALFHIRTASHVVFDNREGEYTTCHLFFDRGSAPNKCSGVVTLTGMFPVDNDVATDWSDIEHYTHDLDLAHRLTKIVEENSALAEKISVKTTHTCKFKLRQNVTDKKPLLCVVSHPHGCSKQITIGCFTTLEMFNNQIFSFEYTTATCPGSSGAQVCVPYTFISPDMYDKTLTIQKAHSGRSDVNPGTNYCQSIPDMPSLKVVSLEILQWEDGPWADNFCCVEDKDLQKHYETCKKNPGHKNFHPVEKFIMDNLPYFYREDDIMNLIKSVSDLTVRVSVRYVSEERPETVQGTDIPYPWFSNRGSNQMRLGTGFIQGVDILENDTCDCKECKNSPPPNTGFARIYIETATHLVYDELEGQHTTCHLLFDSGETPDACKDVITFTDVRDVSSDKVNDNCTITYSTHDMDLAQRLKKMIADYGKFLYSLNAFDDINLMKYFELETRKKPKQESTLYIVVSHPHGCAKHVSICYRDNVGNTDADNNQCPYTWITCPGASGARVVVLGREFIYPYCE